MALKWAASPLWQKKILKIYGFKTSCVKLDSSSHDTGPCYIWSWSFRSFKITALLYCLVPSKLLRRFAPSGLLCPLPLSLPLPPPRPRKSLRRSLPLSSGPLPCEDSNVARLRTLLAGHFVAPGHLKSSALFRSMIKQMIGGTLHEDELRCASAIHILALNKYAQGDVRLISVPAIWRKIAATLLVAHQP
eukprot:5054613-Amphidinium_carterae.1